MCRYFTALIQLAIKQQKEFIQNSHFKNVQYMFTLFRVYFRPLKKGVVLPLATVKRGSY